MQTQPADLDVFEPVPEDEQPIERRGPGRPPGSKNKPKSAEERLASLGVDPIVRLAVLSQQAESEGARALAMKGYAELAQFTDAKKKSVEHTVAPDSPLEHALQLSSAERMLRIQGLMKLLSEK